MANFDRLFFVSGTYKVTNIIVSFLFITGKSNSFEQKPTHITWFYFPEISFLNFIYMWFVLHQSMVYFNYAFYTLKIRFGAQKLKFTIKMVEPICSFLTVQVLISHNFEKHSTISTQHVSRTIDWRLYAYLL